MTFDPKIKIFRYNPKVRPGNPSNKKLNWSGLKLIISLLNCIHSFLFHVLLLLFHITESLTIIYSAPEYILLFGTKLCITSKLHHQCLKKVDRNIP